MTTGSHVYGIRNAMHCFRCCRPVPDGAPIWRMWVCQLARDGFDYSAVQSMCASCSRRAMVLRWHPEQRCAHCGRPVFLDARCRMPRVIACSVDCAAQARERRRGPERLCRMCSKPFRPKRADAVFCSHACRQRAYQRRQNAEAA